MVTQARNIMQNAMHKGNVYQIGFGSFAVVSYSPETEVYAVILPGVDSVPGAIDALVRERSGHFVSADRDTEAWGRIIVSARGYYNSL